MPFAEGKIAETIERVRHPKGISAGAGDCQTLLKEHAGQRILSLCDRCFALREQRYWKFGQVIQFAHEPDTAFKNRVRSLKITCHFRRSCKSPQRGPQ